MIVTLQLICQICVRLYLPVRLKSKAALEDIKKMLNEHVWHKYWSNTASPQGMLGFYDWLYWKYTWETQWDPRPCGARSAVTYKASIFKLQINHVLCEHFSRFTWVSMILYWSTLNGFFGKVGLPGDHNRWLTVIQDRVQKSFRNFPKEKHCTKVNAYTVENRKLG